MLFSIHAKRHENKSTTIEEDLGVTQKVVLDGYTPRGVTISCELPGHP